MAQTRTRKEELIDHYSSGFGNAKHAFLVNFEGMTVSQATDLRSRIREQGGSYEVVKNRLALRAIEGRDLDGLQDKFVGPTAVAYVEDDPVSLAKALADFRKDVPAIEFKGALLDGQPVDASEVDAIAQMPGREELLAKLLFLLQSPITRLARGLAAIPRQFVVVLDQISQERED